MSKGWLLKLVSGDILTFLTTHSELYQTNTSQYSARQYVKYLFRKYRNRVYFMFSTLKCIKKENLQLMHCIKFFKLLLTEKPCRFHIETSLFNAYERKVLSHWQTVRLDFIGSCRYSSFSFLVIYEYLNFLILWLVHIFPLIKSLTVSLSNLSLSPLDFQYSSL